MTGSVSIIVVIVAYYLCYARKYLHLDSLAEPVFIVNVFYALNFPVRAMCLLFIPDSVELAPTFVLDEASMNLSLLYSLACIAVFNGSYQYFNRRIACPTTGAEGPGMPKVSPVPTAVYCAYLILALIFLYYAGTTTAVKTLIPSDAVIGFPRGVRAIGFAVDFILVASLIMFVISRQRVYIWVLAIFVSTLWYNAFLLTAKGPMIGHLVLAAVVMTRLGYRIRLRHILSWSVVVVPYVICSYLGRMYNVGILSPEITLTDRIAQLSEAVQHFSAGQLVGELFLIKITDRQAYLDTLMIYIQAKQSGVTADIYDRYGSLPVLVDGVLSILHVGTTSTDDFLTWFGNKYWYGLAVPTMNVFIPFGRITESYMILGEVGVVMFIGYAYLFVFLYKRFGCSASGLAITYYVMMYYYWIYGGDVFLAFNLTTVGYWSLFYWATVWSHFRVAGRSYRGTDYSALGGTGGHELELLEGGRAERAGPAK